MGNISPFKEWISQTLLHSVITEERWILSQNAKYSRGKFSSCHTPWHVKRARNTCFVESSVQIGTVHWVNYILLRAVGQYWWNECLFLWFGYYWKQLSLALMESLQIEILHGAWNVFTLDTHNLSGTLTWANDFILPVGLHGWRSLPIKTDTSDELYLRPNEVSSTSRLEQRTKFVQLDGTESVLYLNVW